MLRLFTVHRYPYPKTLQDLSARPALDLARWHIFSLKGLLIHQSPSQYCIPPHPPGTSFSAFPQSIPSIWEINTPSVHYLHSPCPKVPALVEHLVHYRHQSKDLLQLHRTSCEVREKCLGSLNSHLVNSSRQIIINLIRHLAILFIRRVRSYKSSNPRGRRNEVSYENQHPGCTCASWSTGQREE